MRNRLVQTVLLAAGLLTTNITLRRTHTSREWYGCYLYRYNWPNVNSLKTFSTYMYLRRLRRVVISLLRVVVRTSSLQMVYGMCSNFYNAQCHAKLMM